MISHRNIWHAIDALAERKGLSVSALARLAGLDPTSFNPSKRTSKDGRERWPSTESLAKILAATEEDMDSFLVGGGVYTQPDIHEQPIPLLGFAQAGAGGFFSIAAVFRSAKGGMKCTSRLVQTQMLMRWK